MEYDDSYADRLGKYAWAVGFFIIKNDFEKQLWAY